MPEAAPFSEAQRSLLDPGDDLDGEPSEMLTRGF